jgi:Flp pilus assembly secretin CpaC/tetratricopeptide (TPR) repeat protein
MSISVQTVKNPMTKVSKILSLVALIAAFDTVSHRAVAQEAGEIAVRREEKAIVLRKTLEAAATAAKQGDLTSAAKAYEDAWNLTEELGSSVEKERNLTIEGFTSTRLALAYNAAKAGEYKEADLQVKRLLKVDPNHIKAKNFKRENDQRLANLVGRVPSEEALSHIGQDKTNKLTAAIAVQDGKLAFEMGHFDRAEAKLQEAIKLDPDNGPAYQYLNIIRESKYTRAHREKLLTDKDKLLEVEQYWEQPKSKLPISNPFAKTNRVYTGAGRQAIYHKLDTIRINEIKFDGLPLGEVVKYLDEQTRLRDPEKKGIAFVVNSHADSPLSSPGMGGIDPVTGQPQQAAQAATEPVDLNNVPVRINPALRDLRLADVLEIITSVAEKPLKYSVEEWGIMFRQRLPEATQLHSRWWRVNPNTFMEGLESVTGITPAVAQGGQGGGQGGGGGGGGGGQQGQGGVFTIPRVEVSGGGGMGGGMGGGGGGGGGGMGGGMGGSGITGVTRTNLTANIQVVVRQFFMACGLNFPMTMMPGMGGQGGAGGMGGMGGGMGMGGMGGGMGMGGMGGGMGMGGMGGGAGGPYPAGVAPWEQDQKALFFNDRTGILFVRATLSDLDVIEKAIQILNVAPPQVEIEARFAEINQTDSKALGFDWLLGNTLIGGGRLGLSGGSAPSYTGQPSAANPGSISPVDGSQILPGGVFPGTSAAGLAAPGANDQLVTSGLRNTTADSGKIPEVFSLTGILTDPQFKVVIRALEQRDGVDLLSAPKVTTLSGRQAHVEVSDVRTIATGLNNQGGGGGGGQGGGGGGLGGGTGGVGNNVNQAAINLIIPGTVSQPFGPVLDVVPYVSSDDETIQMTILPTITEFVGYDDPGPFVPQILGLTSGSSPISRTSVLPLPRLRVRMVTTSAIVWDGQTVALGGLIAEDNVKSRDKVPVLGDVPVLGRLFRSENSRTVKKNLMIFVTATIVDAGGKRVHDPENPPFDPNTTPTKKPSNVTAF